MESRILDHWDAVHARAHRWRWWIRLGLAIVLLLWFWRFGHSRMYTPPVDVNALAMRGVPSPSDPDAGLAAAISRIPPLPPLPAPPEPPAGQQWSPTAAANDWTLPRASINLQEALNGSWTPQTRYHLQAVIAYIESPQMQAALADAAEQVRTVVLPPGYINANLPWSVRQLAILLVVRARCHMAGRQDVVAASQDLACVLDICRMLENDGVDLQHLISIDCRNLVWDEVQHWCREFPLEPAQRQVLSEVLQSHRFDLPARWRAMCRGQSQCELGYLDAYYTKDPDGNGWFVPYVRNSDGLADKALCVLNLLSPVVNDRATVTRKLERVGDKVVRAIDLPYLQAKEALGLGTNDQNRGRVINRGNPVDVQFGAARMLRPVFTYMAFACCAAWEAAAEASLALSVYRTQHGHYPERLADLVPEYLPSLPIDPVTREPLGYRLDKMEEYKLYCAGDDGVDNNARSYDQFALGCYGKSPSDLVFSGPARDKPAIEWYLVPTEDTDNHSATSQP